MKRFYQKVSVGEIDGMYAVLLDGKTIKTPEKTISLLPTKKMAEAIAKEWDNQKEDIDPGSMPITKLFNTAIDRVEKRRGDLIDELVEFAGADQLCYRADDPPELVEQQNKIWDKLLARMKSNHDINFKLTSGIVFIEQDKTELAKIRSLIEKIESFKLVAFYAMVTVTGSVTIGFNLFEGHITVEDAWDAGHLDENFQTAKWGIDQEAQIRRDNLKTELINAYYFLNLC